MAFGIIAILIMLCTMNMDYTDIWHYLLKVGIYFPLILALWLVVYLVNTLSWYLIINDEGRCEGLSFWRVYKLTVSGFALNYTTPCGLMGGEPYRIMELKPYTGVSKATSSVILYVMMHIFSHIFLFTRLQDWHGTERHTIAHPHTVCKGMGSTLCRIEEGDPRTD